MLQKQGVPTAVISMPSWELFERQDEAYRRNVLGPGTVRVAVEAAVRLGWDRYIGESGGFVGMTGFGASGAEDDLWKSILGLRRSGSRRRFGHDCDAAGAERQLTGRHSRSACQRRWSSMKLAMKK